MKNYISMFLGTSSPKSSREYEVIHAFRMAVRLFISIELTHSVVVETQRAEWLTETWRRVLSSIPNAVVVMTTDSLRLGEVESSFELILTLMFWIPLFSVVRIAYMHFGLMTSEAYRLRVVLLCFMVYIPIELYRQVLVYPWLDVHRSVIESMEYVSEDGENDLYLGPNHAQSYQIYAIEVYNQSIGDFLDSIWIGALFLLNWFNLGDSLSSAETRGVIGVPNSDRMWRFDDPKELALLLDYSVMNMARSCLRASGLDNFVDLFLLFEVMTLRTIWLYRLRLVSSRLSVTNVPLNHLGERVIVSYVVLHGLMAMVLPFPQVR